MGWKGARVVSGNRNTAVPVGATATFARKVTLPFVAACRHDVTAEWDRTIGARRARMFAPDEIQLDIDLARLGPLGPATAGLGPAETTPSGMAAASPVCAANTPGISRDGLPLRKQRLGILDSRHVFGTAAE